MNDAKTPSLKKNYIYNLCYQILAVAVPFVITPYISRIFNAEIIGAYSYCYSIVSYFELFGVLGQNMYGQLQISKERNNKEQMSILFWSICVSRAVTLLTCIFVYAVFLFNIHKNRVMYIALTLVMIADIFDVTWFFQGVENFRTITMRNMFVKMFTLACIFLFVKSENDVVLYIIILQGSVLLGNISMWGYLKPYIQRIDLRKLKIMKHIKGSLIFFLPTIATSVYMMMDKSMLQWIVGSDYENGVYEQAQKITLTAATMVSSLNLVLLPRMSFLFSVNRINEYKQKFYETLYIVGLIVNPIAVGIACIAPVFIPVFLGEGYDKSIIILQIFSIWIWVSGINVIIGHQCLIARREQKKYNLSVIMGAMSNLILNIFLIPRLQSQGAAIASVLSEIVMFGMYQWFSRDIFSFFNLIKMWKKSISASIVMGIVVTYLSYTMRLSLVSLVIEILTGVVVYLVMLLFMKERFIASFIKRKGG